MASAASATLTGTVTGVRFHNPQNGWSVLTVNPKGSVDGLEEFDRFSVVGSLAAVRTGDEYTFQGTWKSHPQYGKQFQFEKAEVVLPKEKQGAIAYLATLADGVGVAKAKRIVEVLGDDALERIISNPDILQQFDFLKDDQRQELAEGLLKNTNLAELSALICREGVGMGTANRIYAQYGAESAAIVKENPYILADEVYGIGFKVADRIGRSVNIAPDSPYRVEAAYQYALKEAGNDGHVFLKPRDTIAEIEKLLGKQSMVCVDHIRDAYIELEKRGIVHREGDAIYLSSIYEDEVQLAKDIMRLAGTQGKYYSEGTLFALSNLVEWIQNEFGVVYALEQRDAIINSFMRSLTVVTGGPGTGKCVTRGTLVLTSSGIIPIEALAPTTELPEDTAESLNVMIQGRFSKTETSHFYHGGIKKTIKIKSNAGFEIEGTPNHRILCITEGGPDWKRLDQITARDYVAIHRGSEFWGKETALPNDIEIAYLMGVLTGDGSHDDSGFSLSNPEEELLSYIQKILGEIFHYETKVHKYNDDCPRLSIFRSDIVNDLVARGYSREALAGDKEVPISILQGSRTEAIAFLQGLFDTDGHSNINNGYIEWTTKSAQLAKQVQILLSNLGIITTQHIKTVIREKEPRKYVKSIISGDDARLFYETVGFRLERKQLNKNMLPNASNTNLDVVPLMGNKIRAFIAAAGSHSRKFWWKWKRECNGERNPSRKRLQELIESFKEIAIAHESLIEACSPNLYWDQVGTISHGKAEVYDLTVPSEEAFIANGFVNHNTTVIKGIIEAYRKVSNNYDIMLAAPTGRAAKRMTEATGIEAKTIHRLLCYNPFKNCFEYNANHQLPPGLLIIDEFSMCDQQLSKCLFEAVPDDMVMVIVGDVDQLPSVGPGKVLEDIIDSRKVITTRLKFNYRQASGSRIALEASRIVEQDDCRLHHDEPDWKTITTEEPEVALERIKAEIKNAIKDGLGIMDFQVLAPMKKGIIGVDNLNEVIREIVNPGEIGKPEYKIGKDRFFRLNDKVMVIKNNYKLGVFNGDIGIIRGINSGIVVNFDGEEVTFAEEDVYILTLAYASTVHKSQGSEFPLVIMVVMRSHYIMLQKNLFYTGITRAKEKLVLVCQESAVKRCLSNKDKKERYTMLRDRLISLRREK